MSSIITNVRTIFPESWMQEVDGKWYAHIPFECDKDTDTIMEFADTEDYIKQHQADFDALENGYTDTNTCVITAKHKPTCNIQVSIKTLEEAGGKIMYDRLGNPEYIPPTENNIVDLFSAIGNIQDMIPKEEKEDKKKIVI